MKLDYPATGRNRDVIKDHLSQWIKPDTKILELASGSGQHGDYLTKHLTFESWQPTECDPDGLASIRAYQSEEVARQTTWLPPVELDVSQKTWPVEKYDLVFVANLFHISPPICTERVFEECPSHLNADGCLVVYGPFIDANVATSPSNIEFDLSLISRNSSWGLRSVDWVEKTAERYGMKRTDMFQVPSHNLILKFKLK